MIALVHYVKSHGLGNDYIVIDPATVPFPVTPEAVRLICDRHYGVGSDGVLLVQPAEGGDFGVRIFNPDGSDAEKSGNGIRIVAKYLREHGYASSDRFTIDTAGGRVAVECAVRGGRVVEVTAEMGTVTFHPTESIEVLGRRLAVTSLSIGNPHCVVIVDDLATIDPHTLGPHIEAHRAFPARTNVQFAEVLSRSHVAIEIWERGAGYTLASGSSSCAAVAACHRTRLVDRDVVVTMPGGDLDVTVGDGYAMRLRGPVEEVMSGDLSAELVDKLVGLGGAATSPS
ncbi:MAG TPA: diaminopimelate epimerase [Candidatus Limnocylindria bacterium]|nr:diaminopimelate epimerase [Candidatus Limnocylindria bacterium]